MFGAPTMTGPRRPRDPFAFETDADVGGGVAVAPPGPPAMNAPPLPSAAPAFAGGDSDEIVRLVKALMEARRGDAAEVRGRQFGDAGGLNAAQRQMTMGLHDPASRASALSGFSAANRRAALRAAGIDPNAPGASNVAFTGKTPEEYAAAVQRSIDAEERRRTAGRDRLLAQTARQRADRAAKSAPPVDIASTPEELALLKAMSAA